MLIVHGWLVGWLFGLLVGFPPALSGQIVKHLEDLRLVLPGGRLAIVPVDDLHDEFGDHIRE